MNAYNQFLEHRRHPGGHYGMIAKGLQLFLPLSPRICLIFYDEWAYKIGDRKKQLVTLQDERDVDNLNGLQVLQCEEQLFFNNLVSETYVADLFDGYGSKRLKSSSVTREAGRRIDEQGHEHIMLHSFTENFRINLELSFCTFTKKAKQHEMSDYVAQIRNEKMRTSPDRQRFGN